MAKKLDPIHPGEVLLADFLEPLDVSQYRLAHGVSVPPRPALAPADSAQPTVGLADAAIASASRALAALISSSSAFRRTANRASIASILPCCCLLVSTT